MYRIRGLPEGVHTVVAAHKGFRASSLVTQPLAAETETELPKLVLEPRKRPGHPGLAHHGELGHLGDGSLVEDAMRTRAEYAGALRLMRPPAGDPEGYPMALCVSARTGDGLREAWQAIGNLALARQASGAWAERRRVQMEVWFERAVEAGLTARLDADPAIGRLRRELAAAVAAGRLTPDLAAEQLLDAFAPLRP